MKTAIILDARREKKNNKFPVKLRVTFERKQKYFSTPYNLDEKMFNKVMFGKKLSEEEKDLKKSIQAYENKAIDIIKDMNVITWESFEKKYFTNRQSKDSISDAYLIKINELRCNKNLGTAVMYECALNSLNKFMPNAKFVTFQVDALKKYEQWMLSQKRSVTTIGMYVRTLRTLFNNAIEQGGLSKEYYPFGKKKYEIPFGNNVKKALTMKEIEMIYYFNTENKRIDLRMRDYWLFMYLCNGINIKDMSLLKYRNIKGDVIQFERAKTSRTKRNVEAIRVPLSPQLIKIIEKWGNQIKDENNYIFPILEQGITAERERQLIQQITGVINDHMKKIALELEITSTVTTYAARHSFATILQRSGINVEFISEALGHSNIKTTQNYLGGFEDDKKREVSSLLTNFSNN